MKKFLVALFAITTISFTSHSQTGLPEADKSPMDMAYFPVNYPLLKIQKKTTDPIVARVIYSRPRKEGRSIFGSLVEYGKLWRLGANEATEIEFFKAVTIAGKKIPKGRYTVYAIVNENYWTMILNKETDVWGSFVYNQSKDAVRLEAPVQKLGEPAELLCMTFEKVNTNTINLIIAWENIKVAMPITL